MALNSLPHMIPHIPLRANAFNKIEWFQKIPTPTLRRVTGNSKGGGNQKQTFLVRVKLYLKQKPGIGQIDQL